MLKKIRAFFKVLGPGLTTGAADDDPSGIATYSIAGAKFGYLQLWTALFSVPFMITIQQMCGKIGMVTGKGLAGVIKQHYNKSILGFSVLLLTVSNMINIGADLGAMANCIELSINLLFSFSLFIITLITLMLQIFLKYKTYAKYLKYLTLALFSYIPVAFMVKQNWQDIAWYTFIPSLDFHKEYLINIVAIFGTTVSPYLFFWQTSQEVEVLVKNTNIPEMGKGKPHITKSHLTKMRWDTSLGMIFSCVIMWFMIITTASTLHANHITDIQSADQAAQALKPIAGDFAFALFSIGIIGSGLLAVPTLSGSAAYAICETFEFKEGLGKKFQHAPAFYIIIISVTLVGLTSNFLDIEPFKLLYYSAIFNGICSVPLLIMIILIGSNKQIMKRKKNTLLSNVLAWVVTIFLTISSIALLFVK